MTFSKRTLVELRCPRGHGVQAVLVVEPGADLDDLSCHADRPGIGACLAPLEVATSTVLERGAAS